MCSLLSQGVSQQHFYFKTFSVVGNQNIYYLASNAWEFSTN